MDFSINIADVITILVMIGGVGWIKYALNRDNIKRMDGMSHKIDSNTRLVDEVGLSVRRLELKNLLEHNSSDVLLINQKYDEYIKAGGNTYITTMFNQWKDRQK